MADLTTTQASKLLGLSPATVRRMVDRGEVEAWTTPGGYRRIFRVGVDKMLAARKPRAKGK